MGGDSQPFLYDHPSKLSFVGTSEGGFNPRAASEASWRMPVAKPKIDGPLIQSKEFNRHPDSYFVVPYGNLNQKSMSPRTKDKVKWTRLILLLLRVFSLLGAGGMLFCVICIRNTDAMTGWIIRVPAGIAIIHAVYAIYHLSRSTRGRTPASSASYMLFAAIIDISLVPFYVFAALMARVESVEPAGTQQRWLTLFNNADATHQIIYSTFLISVACGAFHSISFILSLYLGVLYRKISRLPPDMNPLEDNLTSRHKRKKSSLMDNRHSQASTTTSKQAVESEVDDPLMSPVHTVPFMHTRNNSQLEIPEKLPSRLEPLVSRSDISNPLYQQSSSSRPSNVSLAFNQGALSSQSPPDSTAHTKIENPTVGNRHSITANYKPQYQSLKGPFSGYGKSQEQQQAISRSLTKSSSIYSTDTTPATNTTMNVYPLPSAPPLPDNNWITHPSSARSRSPFQRRELKKAAYEPLSQMSHFEYIDGNENQPQYIPENPLEMNPPTRKVEQWKHRAGANVSQGVLTQGHGNVRRHENRTQAAGTLDIGKTRMWDGMSSLVGHRNGGARVVSRSGVQIRGEGILPTGGVRAREVSGKVMEEGRGTSHWNLVSE